MNIINTNIKDMEKRYNALVAEEAIQQDRIEYLTQWLSTTPTLAVPYTLIRSIRSYLYRWEKLCDNWVSGQVSETLKWFRGVIYTTTETHDFGANTLTRRLLGQVMAEIRPKFKSWCRSVYYVKATGSEVKWHEKWNVDAAHMRLLELARILVAAHLLHYTSFPERETVRLRGLAQSLRSCITIVCLTSYTDGAPMRFVDSVIDEIVEVTKQ